MPYSMVINTDTSSPINVNCFEVGCEQITFPYTVLVHFLSILGADMPTTSNIATNTTHLFS